jgi:hypothetical protein
MTLLIERNFSNVGSCLRPQLDHAQSNPIDSAFLCLRTAATTTTTTTTSVGFIKPTQHNPTARVTILHALNVLTHVLNIRQDGG